MLFLYFFLRNFIIFICIINVVNIVIGNNSKPSPLGGDVVVPNNVSNQKDISERMSSLVDDSQQAYLIQNVEQIQHVSPKGDLSHSSGLSLSNSFPRLSVLDENSFEDKLEM